MKANRAFLRSLRGLLALSLFTCFSSAVFADQPPAGSYVNTPFVITNSQTKYQVSTNNAENEVWVSFAGTFTDTGAPQYIGSQTLEELNISYNTAVFQSFNITSLSAVVQGGVYVGGVAEQGTTDPLPFFGTNQQYTFSLNGFSGRVYVNYGSTALSGSPTPGAPGSSPYIVFEPTVLGQTLAGGIPTTSNMDLSYVDGVSAPASTSIRNATTGAALAATSNNPITSNSAILQNVVAAVPNAAVVYSGGEPVRVMSSAAAPSAYHDWTSLMTTLRTNGTVLNVSSYTSGTTSDPYNLSGTYYGYSGAATLGGQPPDWNEKQDYTTTAQFVSDMTTGLTPTQITNLTTAFTTAGFGAPNSAGAVISGSGTISGAFTIFIPEYILNAGTGIYGNNPGYIVMVGDTPYTYASTGIQNDLGGRVVGDLVAGIVFGWSNSTIDITSYAASTNTDFYGATFSSNILGELSTGEYFYLLSMVGAQGKLSEWIGGNIDPNSDHYDEYLAAVTANTAAYASGFTDRLQGPAAPGTFWYTANPPVNPYITSDPPTYFENIGFVEFVLEDFSAIPEPSALTLFGLAGMAVMFRRRRRA